MNKHSADQHLASDPLGPLAGPTGPNAGLPANLPRISSDILEGSNWAKLMATITRSGALIVTHTDEPQAVILSLDSYETLVHLAQSEQERKAEQVAELNKRFDQRLAVLKNPQAKQALDAFMDEPLALDGWLVAGSTT